MTDIKIPTTGEIYSKKEAFPKTVENVISKMKKILENKKALFKNEIETILLIKYGKDSKEVFNKIINMSDMCLEGVFELHHQKSLLYQGLYIEGADALLKNIIPVLDYTKHADFLTQEKRVFYQEKYEGVAIKLFSGLLDIEKIIESTPDIFSGSVENIFEKTRNELEKE